MASNDDKDEWARPKLAVFKSVVWTYFNVSKKDSKKVQCTICGKNMKWNKSTSTLQRHVNNVHPLAVTLKKSESQVISEKTQGPKQ